MTTIDTPPPDPDALRRVSRAIERCPLHALVLRIPNAEVEYANALARSVFGDRPVSFQSATIGPVQVDLHARRWVRFCADRHPYTIVQTVQLDGIEFLVHCAVWAARPDLAVCMIEDLRAGPWAETTATWLDRWAQPALSLSAEGVPVHANRSLVAALGYRRGELPSPDHLRDVAASIEPVLRAADDGRASSVVITDRYGVAVEFVLGRFPELSVIDPECPIITGYAITTAEMPEVLTFREAQIARHLASGSRVVHIADALGLSQHTVRNHLRSTFAKLGVRTQTELIELLQPGRTQ